MVSSSSSNAGGGAAAGAGNAETGLMIEMMEVAAVVWRNCRRFMLRGVIKQDERMFQDPEDSCSSCKTSLRKTNLKRIKKPVYDRRIVQAFRRANDDLIGPATHEVNSRLEDPVVGLCRELDC